MPRTPALFVSLAMPLAACVDGSPPTALANLETPTVSLHAVNDPTGIYGSQVPRSLFEVQVDDVYGDCVRIADDVTATLDGIGLTSTGRGGGDEHDASGDCRAATFSLLDPTSTSSSRLVIADSTATWTIDATNVLANDFELTVTPGSGARVTWHSAPPNRRLDRADAQLADSDGALLWSSVNDSATVPRAVVATGGNGFDIDAPGSTTGTVVLAVSATRKNPIDGCDGPEACTVEARAGRFFTLP